MVAPQHSKLQHELALEYPGIEVSTPLSNSFCAACHRDGAHHVFASHLPGPLRPEIISMCKNSQQNYAKAT